MSMLKPEEAWANIVILLKHHTCVLLSPEAASERRPSTVVMTPFCVELGISKSSSGMRTDALSDFTTCKSDHMVLNDS